MIRQYEATVSYGGHDYKVEATVDGHMLHASATRDGREISRITQRIEELRGVPPAEYVRGLLARIVAGDAAR